MVNLPRRQFLQYLSYGGILSLAPISQSLAATLPQQSIISMAWGRDEDEPVRDAVNKAREFEKDYSDDFFLSHDKLTVLNRLRDRLSRLQRLVGYGHFNLLNYNAAIKYAGRYTKVGSFTNAEQELIEELFSAKASQYGFLGERVNQHLTESVPRRDVVKLSGTGHYLYKGDALNHYKLLRKEIGKQLILTSGIRSIVKQLYLFTTKARETEGNLSRAARQLAPPGHSFHGIGDFDVGQIGLGAANFTDQFASSHVYQRMADLGYNTMRYPEDNPFGVRYEPWHIKVVDHA